MHQGCGHGHATSFSTTPTSTHHPPPRAKHDLVRPPLSAFYRLRIRFLWFIATACVSCALLNPAPLSTLTHTHEQQQQQDLHRTLGSTHHHIIIEWHLLRFLLYPSFTAKDHHCILSSAAGLSYRAPVRLSPSGSGKLGKQWSLSALPRHTHSLAQLRIHHCRRLSVGVHASASRLYFTPVLSPVLTRHPAPLSSRFSCFTCLLVIFVVFVCAGEGEDSLWGC